MKNSLPFLFFLTFSIFCKAQTPKFEWAKTWGGAYDDFAYSLTVDASGNVYTAGSFKDSADFDPGMGRTNLISKGEGDIFISKMDGTGKFLWAKRIGGALNDIPYAIASDASGNVVITGGFIGTVDFDPGNGTTNLISASTTLMDIFVAKYDGNGNLVWAKSVGGTLNDFGSSLAVDANRGIYVTGFFYSTVDFDPDAASTVNLSSSGNSDIFILKLSSSGKFAWAKNIGSSSADAARSIALGPKSEVFTTGSFSGTADFDPGLTEFKLTSAGTTDIFVSKLDSSGNFVWAKSMGGTSDEEGLSIAVSSTGLCVVTGKFTGTADFDPGANTRNLVALGDKDLFIFKLDASGNLSWAEHFKGLLAEIGQSIALDATGNVYATGSFKSVVDFDPGTNKFELTSVGLEDVFILKLDPSGAFVWAKKFGNNFTDIGNCIFVSKTSGSIYLTGFFGGTVDFDPDALKLELMSNGMMDVFTEKIMVQAPQSVDDVSKTAFTISPNPFYSQIEIRFDHFYSTDLEIEIFNALGEMVIAQKMDQTSTVLNLGTLQAGVYFVKAFTKGQELGVRKLVKQ